MDKRIVRYKEAAICLAYDLAVQSYFADEYKHGRSVGAEEMQRVISDTSADKEAFLKAKSALGLTGGLDSFRSSREYHFQGFDIAGGVFTGDPKRVDEICQKYFDELNSAEVQDLDDEMATRFEVSAFAFMLSGDAVRLYHRVVSKNKTARKKSVFKGVFGKILSFFSGMEDLEDAV